MFFIEIARAYLAASTREKDGHRLQFAFEYQTVEMGEPFLGYINGNFHKGDLLQFHQKRWRSAGQHVQFEAAVLVDRHSVLLQMAFYRFACKDGAIIFLAEVAKPYVPNDVGIEIIGKKSTGALVADVSRAVADAFLQMLGVAPLRKHSVVVVRLHNKMSSGMDKGLHLFGEVTHVGNEHESLVLHMNAVAVVLRTVVGHKERMNGKWTKVEVGPGFYVVAQFCGHFLCHMVVQAHGVVHLGGSVDRNAEFLTHSPHGLHVVGVVVSNEYGLYLCERKTVVAEIAAKSADADA